MNAPGSVTGDAVADFFAAGGRHRLWCPALTFYTEDGSLDEEAFARHLDRLAPHVGGILVPGSTGEGWQMSERESLDVLRLALQAAPARGIRVLVGLLRPSAGEIASLARAAADLADAGSDILGFTLAAPLAAEPMDEAALEAAFRPVLETGRPVFLYQLPQVTGSTIPASLLERLSERFPNVAGLKDSSGEDALALGGAPERLVLLRGAEGDVVPWSVEGGGPYRGFLLSSANVFPAELHAVLADLEAGRLEEATALSGRVAAAVGDAFALVAMLPFGNPFTNANKALLHARFGERGAARLHGGRSLPPDVLAVAQQILHRHGFAGA